MLTITTASFHIHGKVRSDRVTVIEAASSAFPASRRGAPVIEAKQISQPSLANSRHLRLLGIGYVPIPNSLDKIPA